MADPPMVVIRTDPKLVVIPAPPVGATGAKGDPGSPGEGYPTRSTMAARAAPALLDDVYLAEAGREGKFVVDDASSWTAAITADPLQGIFVVSSTDATKVYRRIYDGPIMARWFGGGWNGTTDDSAVINAAIALSNALIGSNLLGYGAGVPAIQLPFAPGGINCGTTTIVLTQATALRGYSGGDFGGEATLLKFGTGCHGIQIDGANVILEGIQVRGPWVPNTGMSEGEYHGFKAHRRFTGRDLGAWDFQGDGFHINISAGSGGDTEGNDNDVWVERVVVNSNRNGIYLAGADVNAGCFSGVDANYNRQAGIFDNSFLGNTHPADQTSGNGVQSETSQTFPYTCSFNSGHVFYCVIGQESWCSTNSSPSTATSNQGWRYWKDAGAAPAYAPQWTTGQTWRAGGAFLSARLNGQSVYQNPYSESDQAPSQLGQNDLVIGGQGAFDSIVRRIVATFRGIELSPSVYISGGNLTHVQGPNTGTVIDSSAAGLDAQLIMNNGNVSNYLIHQHNGSQFASTFANVTFGLFSDVNSGLAHYFRIAGSTIVDVESAGVNLASGKVLKVNGTQVVGAQQSAPPADATDLATAIALVNSLKTIIRAHGLAA